MVKSLLQKGSRGSGARARSTAHGAPRGSSQSQFVGSQGASVLAASTTPLEDDGFDDFEGGGQQQQQPQHHHPVSPLVKSGFLINPLSGRPIKIGGDTYNRLLEEGYVPDIAAGVLLLPQADSQGLGQRSRGAPGSSSQQKQQVETEEGSTGSKRPPRFQW